MWLDLHVRVVTHCRLHALKHVDNLAHCVGQRRLFVDDHHAVFELTATLAILLRASLHGH
jgi:hypothetical protein